MNSLIVKRHWQKMHYFIFFVKFFFPVCSGALCKFVLISAQCCWASYMYWGFQKWRKWRGFLKDHDLCTSGRESPPLWTLGLMWVVLSILFIHPLLLPMFIIWCLATLYIAWPCCVTLTNERLSSAKALWVILKNAHVFFSFFFFYKGREWGQWGTLPLPFSLLWQTLRKMSVTQIQSCGF